MSVRTLQRIFCGVQYHGRRYLGWQRQSDGHSVQGTVEDMLGMLFGPDVVIHGASRTDKGVHALENTFHVDLPWSRPHGKEPWTAERVLRSLNGIALSQKAPVAFTFAREVPYGFHSRYDSIAKSYTYQVLAPREEPWGAFRPVLGSAGSECWIVPKPLSWRLMEDAARQLRGRVLDFSTFQGSGCTARTAERYLDELSILETPWPLWPRAWQSPQGSSTEGSEVGASVFTIRVRCANYLYRMVRNLVGFLVEVGSGSYRFGPSDVEWVLALRSRGDAAYLTAPACGLRLERVHYPPWEELLQELESDTKRLAPDWMAVEKARRLRRLEAGYGLGPLPFEDSEEDEWVGEEL